MTTGLSAERYDPETLDPFFNPGNVAVIGASKNPHKFGHIITRNFKENGFPGEIYPVNPGEDTILGYTAYDSVEDVPEQVDLAVVVVPPSAANTVVQECINADVKTVAMITAGYREAGEEGEEREQELAEIIQTGSTRVMGPNCVGVWNPYSKVDTLFMPDYKLQRPEAGKVALVSQSGAFASALMDWNAEKGIGLSAFASYGNQVDVSEVEILDYLSRAGKTDAIACYLEGVKNGELFLDKIRGITERTPVIVYKGGKSAQGSKAASSHTGSLAGSYNVYRGVFRQNRLIEAETVEEILDISRGIVYNQDGMENGRVAVVTNGGGFGVIASDAVIKNGLELAPIPDPVKNRLRDVVPDFAAVNNPIDVVGDADPDRFKNVLDILRDVDSIDAFLTITLMQPVTLTSEIVDVLVDFKHSCSKPLVNVMSGSAFTNVHVSALEKEDIPVYPTPERAAAVLKALRETAERQPRPSES